MSRSERRIGRRFPDYGWAWPTGSLDQLLKAALVADEQIAFGSATRWLDSNDIDQVSFREHRLLATIADRFGRKLAAHPTFPRLSGLRKMLWTKSRMAASEAAPVLAAMNEAGCQVMLIKGASRIAIDPAALRGRISHDIDILVQPHDAPVAFDALQAEGWKASTGVSSQYLRRRLPALRSMNFFKGPFGDIDLHQAAYHLSQANVQDDLAIWQRARPAMFGSAAVLIPSPADRMALAIGHGGLDGHTHSDWLVDCAATAEAGDVDWDTLIDIVRHRAIAVPAAAALSYLRTEIGSPIDEAALAAIIARADAAHWRRWSGLLQAKPRTDLSALAWLSRGFAKQFRLQHGNAAQKKTLPDTVWRGRDVRAGRATLSATPALTATLVPPASGTELELTVRVNVPPVRRRIELEINAGERHLVRLRKRILGKSGGDRVLRFRGRLNLQPSDTTLTVEARPSRQTRTWEDATTMATYGALPFELISAKFTPR